MMRKHIQHTKSCIRSRSFGANACGSRKEEDEDENEKKIFGYCFSSCYFEVKECFRLGTGRDITMQRNVLKIYL
jgi:hypothetical protein